MSMLLLRRHQWAAPFHVHYFRRFISTSKDGSAFRNMALMAHIDSGKTTLTESILLKSSYIQSSGTVDTGSTTTDFLPVERERGITVQSASIPVEWKKWTLNLIDTPGHADFGMEVECASSVIDGGVVLMDAVEGVEAQTKGVWRQLDRYNVKARMMFVNKLDRPGASLRSSIRSIVRHGLHKNPVVVALPIASFDAQNYARGEPGLQGLVDLVQWKLWKWDGQGNATPYDLPTTEADLQNTNILPSGHPLIKHLPEARAALVENLVVHHPDFVDTVLQYDEEPSPYLSVPASDILPALRETTISGATLPVLCGSALQHMGTELVMDYVGELFPSPKDRALARPPSARPSANGPVELVAWKVTWDERKGWMTFVRVCSGTLRKQAALVNTNRNQKERIAKLLLLYASEAKEVEELPFGSVGVILGLKYTRTGDILTTSTTPGKISSFSNLKLLPAVVSASVIPQTQSDLIPVQNALTALVRTDPSVRVDTQEGQLLVHGLGSLHLEIVQRKLKDTWKVEFEFGKRYVNYREGCNPAPTSENWNVWNADVNGKPVSVKIPLQLRPLEADERPDETWDGNVVVDQEGKRVPDPEAIRGSNLGYVAEGILNAIGASPCTSLPITGAHIQIGDLKNLPTKAPAILIGATSAILRDHFRRVGRGPILEPFVNLKISIPESSFGKTIKDLTENGGHVLELGEDETETSWSADSDSAASSYLPPDWVSPSGSSGISKHTSTAKRSVNAVGPLSRFLDYSDRLRALAGGHGVFEMSPAGFEVVSDARQLEILREIGRA